MRRRWKRFLAGLLTAVMLTTILPVQAMAAIAGNSREQNEAILAQLKELWGDEVTAEQAMALLKEHGLRKIRFHDLRHSCASLLLKQGVPMKQIQEWLGHSDISTTANIYAHLDSQSKQLSAATMEKALALPEELPESRW